MSKLNNRLLIGGLAALMGTTGVSCANLSNVDDKGESPLTYDIPKDVNYDTIMELYVELFNGGSINLDNRYQSIISGIKIINGKLIKEDLEERENTIEVTLKDGKVLTGKFDDLTISGLNLTDYTYWRKYHEQSNVHIGEGVTVSGSVKTNCLWNLNFIEPNSDSAVNVSGCRSLWVDKGFITDGFIDKNFNQFLENNDNLKDLIITTPYFNFFERRAGMENDLVFSLDIPCKNLDRFAIVGGDHSIDLGKVTFKKVPSECVILGAGTVITDIDLSNGDYPSPEFYPGAVIKDDFLLESMSFEDLFQFLKEQNSQSNFIESIKQTNSTQDCLNITPYVYMSPETLLEYVQNNGAIKTVMGYNPIVADAHFIDYCQQNGISFDEDVYNSAMHHQEILSSFAPVIKQDNSDYDNLKTVIDKCNLQDNTMSREDLFFILRILGYNVIPIRYYDNLLAICADNNQNDWKILDISGAVITIGELSDYPREVSGCLSFYSPEKVREAASKVQTTVDSPSYGKNSST